MSRFPELKGKVALITGAGRAGGLGEGIARRLAAEGCRVVITDIGKGRGPEMPPSAIGSDEEMARTAAAIRADGGDCTAMSLDVLEESQVEAVIAEIAAIFGGIDILVNNASAISLTGTLATPMKRYDLMHQINARGTFLVSQK